MASVASAQDGSQIKIRPDTSGFPDIETQTPLSKSELTRVFTDRTHHGSYNFMRRNIDTVAFTETTSADNRTYHKQGKRVDTGSWNINKNQICFSYDTVFSSGCFHMYQSGNCYYHFVLTPPPASGLGHFTARSFIKGETPNCRPNIS